MNPNTQAKHVGVIFIAILLISGVVLMYRGNDAVALSTEKKEGIVTAEQIKLSFDSVSGRLINESVVEGQLVTAGDLVMQLDPTDTDLSIAQLKAQIGQLDAQIKSTSGSMGLSFYQARNDEQQSFRQIDSQRAALASAKATLANAELDYSKKRELIAASTKGTNIARRGIMERIRDIIQAGLYAFEESAEIQSEYGIGIFNYGAMGIMTDDSGMSEAIYSWSMQKYKNDVQKENDGDSWDELEKSIIANIADEVQVGISRDRITLTIYKTFMQ